MNKNYRIKPYLIILLVLLVAYLPLSSFHFAMKNDAFSDNFFNKFFFTESIRSGYLPLWNPYLNFGYPIYADPGFAFWSPLTWFFGTVIGYTAYTLTFEVLLYIYIGGIAMFEMAKYLKFNTNICIALGCMYMCSGFFVGNLQHINFITSAAFIPLLTLGLLKVFYTPSLKSCLFFVIFSYFVVCGGHPAIPIVTVYFLLLLILLLFIYQYKEINSGKVLLYLSLSLIITSALFAPAFFSYLDILHDYSRKAMVNQAVATDTGYNITSYISFLFPFATGVKSNTFFADNLAMRNGYFSATGFTILVTSVFIAKQSPNKVFFFTGLLMLLFSAGGQLKAHLYSTLPLLSYIKTNGEFRIFSIFCFCLSAGFGLNQIVLKDKKSIFIVHKALVGLILISATGLAVSTIKYGNEIKKFLVQLPLLPISKIKALVDNSPLAVYFVIGALITLFILIMTMILIKKNKHQFIYMIIIADLIFNTILYLPVTGIGQTTLKEIQSYYNKSPDGIPIPQLIAINTQKIFNKKTTGLIGDWSLYSKQPGTTHLVDYPSYFSSTELFLNSPLKKNILDQPFIFIKKADGTYIPGDDLRVGSFTPTSLKATVRGEKTDSLILLQNFYKYWTASCNGKSVHVNRSHITFMSIPLENGINEVEFQYKDNKLRTNIIIWISVIMTLLVIISLNTFSRTLY